MHRSESSGTSDEALVMGVEQQPQDRMSEAIYYQGIRVLVGLKEAQADLTVEKQRTWKIRQQNKILLERGIW